MFRMCDSQDLRRLGCRMLRVWGVAGTRFWGYGKLFICMLGMWDVQDIGLSGCEMLSC